MNIILILFALYSVANSIRITRADDNAPRFSFVLSFFGKTLFSWQSRG